MRPTTIRTIREEVLGRVEDGFDAGTKVLTFEISYTKGGINYFNYSTDNRGYYLHVRPETKHDRGSRSFMIGSGLKAFLEPAKAFSAKKLAAIVVPEDLIARVREKVLAQIAEDEGRRAGYRRPVAPAAPIVTDTPADLGEVPEATASC